MNISRFFPLLLSLLLSLGSFANSNNDTIPSTEGVQPFVRFGIDLSSFARGLIEPEVKQYEFALDSEVFPNWFINLEGGWMNVSTITSNFDYKASGFFFRVGPDFNLLKRPSPRQQDLVTFGMRYAYSFQQHEAPYFLSENPYWGDYEGSVGQSSFNAHWIEFAGGVKAEVFQNFFLSWSLRTRVKLYTTRNSELDPYYLPGYGQGKRRAPVMVHYSLLYRFSL